MSTIDRKPWTPQEDDAIRELVINMGIKKWSQVSAMLQSKYNIQNKTGKQCRERWNNHLNPAISKDPWSDKEDEIIVDFQKKYGNCWSEMAKVLPGRTENAIKNRFYSKLRKCLRSYNKNRPKGMKITASIKTILKDQYTVEILLSHGEGQIQSCLAEKTGPDIEKMSNKISQKIAIQPKNLSNSENLEEVKEDTASKIVEKSQSSQAVQIGNYYSFPSSYIVTPNAPDMLYMNYQQQNWYNYQRAIWASYITSPSINQLYNTSGQI
ncbi:unnamed protein product [Blepharisma stoltei]|uniref:Myb-like DNA-binding domain containing protein n=1 Tax=Blepharisma stoltei TaxID=1481888 RepID=A0AAU9ICI7_9CILI|nr:unnamed protein product [Blepharisma stoltei]